MVRVVIHTNIRAATPDERARGLTVGNQVETAEWLREGFAANCIEAEITADRTKAGDIQVVQGPHYCLDYWRERSDKHRVLWLDRCFYGDSRFDLSIGWLKPDGSREFGHKRKQNAKGKAPAIAPLKPYRGSCVVFFDYGKQDQYAIDAARKIHPRVYFRPHPAERPSVKALPLTGSLAEVWALCDTAIGHSSTVLVDSVLNGLHTTSTDQRHVIGGVEHDRERWAAQLTWCQWNHTEIKSGAFWEHLSEHNC